MNLLDYITEPNEYTLSIKTIGKDFYFDSEYSDEITYKHKLKLQSVSNISYNIIDSKVKILWNEIENANSYNLKIVYDKFTFIKNDIKENNYTYTLTKSGKYNIYVQAVSEDENYIESDYSDSVSIDYIITLSSPTNFNYQKEDSYLVLSWIGSQYAKYYLLKNENLDLNIETSENQYKILLSKFNANEEYIFTLSSLGKEEDIINSPEVHLSYTHTASENKGETFLIDNEEYRNIWRIGLFS